MIHHRPNTLVALVGLFCSIVIAIPSRADDWPQFLGQHRNGISNESGLLESWPDGGPKVLWQVPGGVGMSSFAIVGDKALTTWNTSNEQVLVALSIEDGSTLWETSIGAKYENGQGDGPRATPTVSGQHVYAYSGDGNLVCVKVSNGDLVWSTDILGLSGGNVADYGMASSPLVVGNEVIVTAGGRASVVAVNSANGKSAWMAGTGAPGYASPALLRVDRQPQVVTFTGNGVMGIEPGSGNVLWDYPFKTPYDCNTASPINAGENIFISAGENHGCVMLSVSKQNNQYQVREVWASIDVKSVLRNEWQTSVYLDGYLYGFDNVGSAGPTTHLTCVDAKTGQVAWQKTRFGKGNLVAAAGKLWITTMKGELVLVKATPKAFVELGRKRMFGKTRQAVAIAGGKALIRDNQNILCLEIARLSP